MQEKKNPIPFEGRTSIHCSQQPANLDNHLDDKPAAFDSHVIKPSIADTVIRKNNYQDSLHSDPILSQKDKSNVACCDLNSEVMSIVEPKEINGCKVFVHFCDHENPQVQVSIATLLIEAFLKRRENA